MNILTSNPDQAIEMARHTIADRIQQAEARRELRTIRRQRRPERPSGRDQDPRRESRGHFWSPWTAPVAR
jgi:hypothetical protein